MESFYQFIAVGSLTAVAFIVLLFKLPWRRLLPYHWFLDFGVTFFLMMVLQGTYSGMIAGLVGGIVFSVFMIWLHKCFDAEVPRVSLNKGGRRVRVQWVRKRV